MALKVTKTDVWVAEIKDEPGGLAACLEPLAAAGADLECVIGRRQTDRKGTGAVFVTPLKGRKVQAAAAKVGFHFARPISTLKIEGDNRPGIGAEISRAVGAAGANMRGTSAMVMGRKFVCYLGFDTAGAANKAANALRRIGKK